MSEPTDEQKKILDRMRRAEAIPIGGPPHERFAIGGEPFPVEELWALKRKGWVLVRPTGALALSQAGRRLLDPPQGGKGSAFENAVFE